MEDERIVPALVSVYKAEVWHHLGFCGNVCPGTAARVPPRSHRLPRPVWKAFRVKTLPPAARLQLSLMLGEFCAVRAVLASQSRRFHAGHKYKPKNLWNPSWKVLRMFNICMYLFYCFTNVLFSLGIQLAFYFSLILSRCNLLFRSKCYDIVARCCVIFSSCEKMFQWVEFTWIVISSPVVGVSLNQRTNEWNWKYLCMFLKSLQY